MQYILESNLLYLAMISAASREPPVTSNESLYFRKSFERALNSAVNFQIVSGEIYPSMENKAVMIFHSARMPFVLEQKVRDNKKVLNYQFDK